MMNKLSKIFLSISILIILVLFLYFLGFGIGAYLNEPVNYLLHGPLDQSCDIDSDCVLGLTQCDVSCGCGTAVNKNWNHKCYFGVKYPDAMCKPCPNPNSFDVRCVNNICQKIFDLGS